MPAGDREKLKDKELKLTIDLKPALSMEQLEKRVLRDFEENQNRQFKNAVGKLFPSKLIPVMIELSGIGEEKKVNVISREERQKFVSLIKNLPVTLTGLRGYNEAIITKGGVKVKEIDPATMESKLVKGLYFAGEVLDLDAVTGVIQPADCMVNSLRSRNGSIGIKAIIISFDSKTLADIMKV